MRILCRILAGAALFSATLLSAQTPTLYFTDLTSGPVGSIVTVYGANLTSPVSVNGVVANTVLASSSKISFVVPATTSGNVTDGGSNPLPFAVRTGNLLYVATTGSDTNKGTAAAPYKTIPKAFNAAACGDIVYALNGVNQTGADAYNASLSVTRRCTADLPVALIGYPGATVTVGSTTAQEYGIRNPDVNGDGYNGVVFANLVIRGGNEAMKAVGNQFWRVVGNDFSCPKGGGLSGCVVLSSQSNFQFLGNTIHDAGAGGTKYYHSFYASTNSNHIEVGWNYLHSNKSCRGIEFYSTSGSPQYDLIVHDNVITDQGCDGINFSTVDATKGPIEAYNNLVYHVGVGGITDGLPNYSCIASLGYGTPGGQALFYGNTLADCGSAGGTTAGAITVYSGSPLVMLVGNLILQNTGEVLYSKSTNQSLVSAGHNFINMSGTSGIVDASYHPIAGSPAVTAGVGYPGILFDLEGQSRPQSGVSDAGAYLSFSVITPPPPPPPPPPTAISPTGFAVSQAGSSLVFSWVAPDGIPPCDTTQTVDCFTGYTLDSAVLDSAQIGYTTPAPKAGTYSYTLAANLAKGTTKFTSTPVSISFDVIPVPVVLTGTFGINGTLTFSGMATLTGTLPDGTPYSFSAPVSLTVNASN